MSERHDAGAAGRYTPGPWGIEVGVSSVGLGFNGIYHAVKIGGRSYTVAHTEEITGDVETVGRRGPYVTQRVVNPRPPQRKPHPDVCLIAAAPAMFDYINKRAKAGDREAAKVIRAALTGGQR